MLPGIADVHVAPGRANDDVVASGQEAAGRYFEVGPPTEDYADRIDEAVSVEVTALWAFAIAAALAGLVIVYQAMSRNAAEAAAERTTLETLGLTRRGQMLGSVARLSPAILGGLVGAIGLAVALSPVFPRGLARRADPSLGVLVDWPVLIVGGLAIVAVGVLLGVAAARRQLAGAPVSRGRPPAAFVDRAAGSLSVPAGLGVRLALAPAGRRAHVGWAGITGAAVAVAGLMAVAAIDQSTQRLMTTPHLFGADWDAVLETSPEHDVDELVESVADVPGVAAVGTKEMLAGESDAMATGPGGRARIDPESFHAATGAMAPTVTDGRLPSGASEVAIGATVARVMGADIGDRIEVEGRGGPVDFEVVGRVITDGTDELGDGFVLTVDGLDSLTADCTQEDEESPEHPECRTDTTGIGVAFEPDAEPDQVMDRLAEIDDGFQPTPLPSVVNNLGQIGSTPWFLAAFLALLGVAGLAHARGSGTRRRTHDVAVLRALGIRPAQAGAAVRWQAVALGLIGGLAGVFFGVIAGRLVWQRVAQGTGALVETVVPVWAWIVAPLAALVIALLVSLVPASRAAAVRPAEALRTE
jgi:hypothetical protein